MSRSMQRLVHVLFLLSGATALAYQVTWVRNLTLIFGASYQATSIVLASFMGGLCLGGFWFGRRSDRLARPLRTYALLEIGIALYACALPSLLSWVDGVYVAIALASDGVTPALNALPAGAWRPMPILGPRAKTQAEMPIPQPAWSSPTCCSTRGASRSLYGLIPQPMSIRLPRRCFWACARRERSALWLTSKPILLPERLARTVEAELERAGADSGS